MSLKHVRIPEYRRHKGGQAFIQTRGERGRLWTPFSGRQHRQRMLLIQNLPNRRDHGWLIKVVVIGRTGG